MIYQLKHIHVYIQHIVLNSIFEKQRHMEKMKTKILRFPPPSFLTDLVLNSFLIDFHCYTFKYSLCITRRKYVKWNKDDNLFRKFKAEISNLYPWVESESRCFVWPTVQETVFFLFFFLGLYPRIWKFPGEGPNQSYSCQPMPQPQ